MCVFVCVCEFVCCACLVQSMSAYYAYAAFTALNQLNLKIAAIRLLFARLLSSYLSSFILFSLCGISLSVSLGLLSETQLKLNNWTMRRRQPINQMPNRHFKHRQRRQRLRRQLRQRRRQQQHVRPAYVFWHASDAAHKFWYTYIYVPYIYKNISHVIVGHKEKTMKRKKKIENSTF